MRVRVEDIQTIPNPSIENDWGTRISLLCDKCNEIYHVEFFDKAMADQFFKSLKEGIILSENVCKQCYPIISIASKN